MAVSAGNPKKAGPKAVKPKKDVVYEEIIKGIFLERFKKGTDTIHFVRKDIGETAERLGLKKPANSGDVLSTYRFRKLMPDAVQDVTPKGKMWIIRLAGRGKYTFNLIDFIDLTPRQDLVVTKIPYATPEIVRRYAMSDEQALLAIVRYNRLIDIFTGVTCYSLQNHLRTTVTGMGQVETDELYVGVDSKGANYVIPVQAKGGKDMLSVVQIEQDLRVCQEKKFLKQAICLPVAAQFMSDEVIALFQFEEQDGKVKIAKERHYRLVPHKELSDDDLALYRQRV